jgi:hypothetical protein
MKTSKTPRLEGVTIKTSVKKKPKTPKPGQVVRWLGYDKKWHSARVTRVYQFDNPTGKLCDIAVTLVDPLSGSQREVLLSHVKFTKKNLKGRWSWRAKK